jgi:hypothetical protein
MADKRGQHPNSRANLLKGMIPPKLMYTDSPSQRLANSILEEKTEYNGEEMTNREAILRQQLDMALTGDLRACQFLIELAGRNEANASTVKTATMNPLEQLQEMMQQSKVDDRRKKAD